MPVNNLEYRVMVPVVCCTRRVQYQVLHSRQGSGDAVSRVWACASTHAHSGAGRPGLWHPRHRVGANTPAGCHISLPRIRVCRISICSGLHGRHMSASSCVSCDSCRTRSNCHRSLWKTGEHLLTPPRLLRACAAPATECTCKPEVYSELFTHRFRLLGAQVLRP